MILHFSASESGVKCRNRRTRWSILANINHPSSVVGHGLSSLPCYTNGGFFQSQDVSGAGSQPDLTDSRSGARIVWLTSASKANRLEWRFLKAFFALPVCVFGSKTNILRLPVFLRNRHSQQSPFHMAASLQPNARVIRCTWASNLYLLTTHRTLPTTGIKPDHVNCWQQAESIWRPLDPAGIQGMSGRSVVFLYLTASSQKSSSGSWQTRENPGPVV